MSETVISAEANEIDQVCADILQTPKARVEVPVNPEAISTLLESLYYPLPIVGFTQPGLALAHREVRDLVRHLKDAYHQRGLKLNLEELDLRRQTPFLSVHLEGEGSYGASDMRSFARNELQKLPSQMVGLVYEMGLSIYLNSGPISDFPQLKDSRLGNTIGMARRRVGAFIDMERIHAPSVSVNVILHEFMHTLEDAIVDSTHFQTCMSAKFLKIWRESVYQDGDEYMEDYPWEAFAEFGARYYNSSTTRRHLHELYPKFHQFFSEFERMFASHWKAGVICSRSAF